MLISGFGSVFQGFFPVFLRFSGWRSCFGVDFFRFWIFFPVFFTFSEQEFGESSLPFSLQVDGWEKGGKKLGKNQVESAIPKPPGPGVNSVGK